MLRGQFLRLSVSTVALNHQGHVLLSRRGDFDVWNLPGGRPDAGEALTVAAAREVEEETGLRVRVQRAVGLSYYAGRSLLKLVFAGTVQPGGTLLQRTSETKANTFFDPLHLPDKLFDPGQVAMAVAPVRPFPLVYVTPEAELGRVRRTLARRYVLNLLRGRPEPFHVKYSVRAVALVYTAGGNGPATLRDGALPTARVTGRIAPWLELGAVVRRALSLQDEPRWQWAGLWQHVKQGQVDLVFAARVPGLTLPEPVELSRQDADYAAWTRPGFENDPAWVVEK